MNGRKSALLALLASLVAGLGPATVAAHEFWAEPTRFALEQGSRVGVRLCVGDGFEGWSLARNPGRIERFVATGPAGELPIVGLDGSDPAGVVWLTRPGGYIVGFRSSRAFTEIPVAEFDRYVGEKGLERIVTGRVAKGAARRKVREAYFRHAKALIRVGDAGDAGFDRAIGLRLELVAESGLSRAVVGASTTFRLLYKGKPLTGALVTATRPGTVDEDLKARTGADGRARFRLRAPGMWRIAAVHLVDPPRDVAADWESLWASLTFEIPSQGAAGARWNSADGNGFCRNKLDPSASRS